MPSSARPQASKSGKNIALVKRSAGLTTQSPAAETTAFSGDDKRRRSRSHKNWENRRNFLRHKIAFWEAQVSTMKADLAEIDEDIDAQYAEYEVAVWVRRNPSAYKPLPGSQVAAALAELRGIRTLLLDEWLEKLMIDLEVERLSYRKDILRGERRLLTLRQELKISVA